MTQPFACNFTFLTNCRLMLPKILTQLRSWSKTTRNKDVGNKWVS